MSAAGILLPAETPAAAPAHGPLRDLHDVATRERPEIGGALDRVGMTEIELPVTLLDPEGRRMTTPARVDAFVSLDDPDAKGIHMSRLFLQLQDCLAQAPLEPAGLRPLLQGFIDSHAETSLSACVELRFDYMIRRAALLSGHEGWRSYPIRVRAELDPAGFRAEIGFRVTYSSTCPCSAALSRQHVQERFLEKFGGRRALPPRAVAEWLVAAEGVSATPHSQRSHADVSVGVSHLDAPRFVELIDAVEAALATPVQAAVKRVDEQEFARLNGANPMFCEDAARRVQHALLSDERISEYHVRVEHQESLHPHNAVSSVSGRRARDC